MDDVMQPARPAPELESALRGDAFYDDPYPTYRRFRDEAPILHDAETGLWFVSRYADVERALKDPALFSSSGGNALSDSPLRVGRTLGSMDPPRHDELRAIMVRGFNPRRISATLPEIAAGVKERIASASTSRGFDLVGDLTRPVVVEALAKMLGLDPTAARRAARLQSHLFHHDSGPLGAALAPQDMAEVFVLLREQLDRRRHEPSDDLFSVLLEAQLSGLPVSDEEIVANMSTVLLAGAASIGHYAPNLFHALWARPDQRREVLADLGLADAAIEEAVRWDTSTQAFARVTLANCELSGVKVPAGARLALLYASANRDERVIEAPEVFNLHRKRVRHFGFGGGPHHCLGAPLARGICRTLLQEALPRLGEFDLDTQGATRVRHLMVRGFSRLPIAW